MLTKVLFLFGVLYAKSGYTKAYSILPSDYHDEGHYGGHHKDLRYHGPTAVPHVLHDGHIADTHEVRAAKAEHFEAVAKAQTHSGHHHEDSSGDHHGYSHHASYHGPTAVPHILHDGHIADTHEVAAAKADHFAAVAKAQTHSGDHHEVSSGTHHGYSHHASYHGPTAIPHVLHDGHIADTHEVRAAKAEHFEAVAKVQTHSGYHHGGVHGGYSGTHYDDAHHASYHGPTAVPHVLHDGHIADTREVAAAKAEHFAAVSKAHSHSGYHHGDDYSGTHHGYTHHASYHGPTARPHVLHTGYLADTHEVAAAKQHHHNALNSASHRSYGHHHH